MSVRSDIAADEGGSAFIEYLILLGAFSLVIAGAFLALGPLLVRFYHHIQLIWSAPFP